MFGVRVAEQFVDLFPLRVEVLLDVLDLDEQLDVAFGLFPHLDAGG